MRETALPRRNRAQPQHGARRFGRDGAATCKPLVLWMGYSGLPVHRGALNTMVQGGPLK